MLSDEEQNVRSHHKAQTATQWGYIKDDFSETYLLVPISYFNDPYWAKRQNGTQIGCPSLQDILVTQVIRQLELDPEPQLILPHMTELQQKRVLRRLVEERTQMRMVVHEAKKRELLCPQADHQLWSRRWARLVGSENACETPSGVASKPSQEQQANDAGTPETRDTEDLETSEGDSDDNLEILKNGSELRSHFHYSWQLTSGEGLIGGLGIAHLVPGPRTITSSGTPALLNLCCALTIFWSTGSLIDVFVPVKIIT
jgi:hypothetical protein